MTFDEFHTDLEKLTVKYAQLDKEVTVEFDFPIHGVSRKYKISKVTENGIILRNEDSQRPLGHE